MAKHYSPERATTYRDCEHKRRTLKLNRDSARKLKAARDQRSK